MADLTAIHYDAVVEFDEVQGALRDERLQCLNDRRFYSIAGAQWEGPLGEQFENKPKFEVNKIHLAVMRIINEYRNNRITVDFVSKHGDENDQLADACDGLYRADEQHSVADEAYDNAFEEAVGGGFGAWRLRADYEDEYDDENEQQRILIEPIYDADSSVFFDLNAKRQDKRDATKCWVITAMSPGAYKETYDDDPARWPKDVERHEFDWNTPDVVYVAEYYVVEITSETIRIFENLQGDEEKYTEADFINDEDLEDTLLATGSKEIRQRKVKRRKVHKYIMSGSKILEDCGYIAGEYIPIVPTYGKRWFVDNVERCMGHVRLGKDPQRLKNMQLSKLGEISAYSSVEKPILTPEQIAGHGVMWSEDNIKDYPYLLINPITNANGEEVVSGPVAYTRSPQIPPAMAALLKVTEQDIQDILGNQQGADKVVSNISGDAVDMIQQRLDMQTFIYMSNMAKAVKRSGEIWLSIAKDIFVEPGRKMKSVGLQGETSTVELMRPVQDKAGATVYENDFSRAKLDVYSDVGPSSSSKRSATVRALTGMMQVTTDQETMQVLSAMSMMNMEGEGIAEVRNYFRQKLIRMGVVEPNEDEKKDLDEEEATAKPDAQTQYFESAAANEEAQATEAKADTLLKLAKVDESKANVIETMSKVEGDEQQQAIDAVEAINRLSQNIGSRQPIVEEN